MITIIIRKNTQQLIKRDEQILESKNNKNLRFMPIKYDLIQACL